jgi:diguanylate cyclase (GGDEF)-like protein
VQAVPPIVSLRITVFAVLGGALLLLLTLLSWFAREALAGASLAVLGLGALLLLAAFGVLLLEHRARSRAGDALSRATREVERAQQDVQRRAGDLQRLGEFGEQLQGCRAFEEVAEVLGLAMQGLLPQFAGALYLQALTRNVLIRQAVWGKPAVALEETFGPEDCWAVRRGVLYPAGGRAPACRHIVDALAAEHSLCAPLRAQGETLGVLHLIGPAAPSQVERRLAQTIADQLALTIANQRLRDTLRIQQVRDPLTGLFNRRYLDESMLREGLRARRRNQTLSLLMIDLDHFKRFTDRHGHDVGEVALAQIASQVAQSIRQDDIACRYGGEEFVVVLPDTDLETAVEQADAIRRAVKAAHIDFHGRRLEVITVSIGVAAYPLHGAEPALCLRAADKALNAAKEAGRDRVEVAEPITGESVAAPTKPAKK